MKLQDIKSTLVHAAISGSATPALDIVSMMGQGKLTQDDKNEAIAYFESRGGLQAVATAEQNFMIQHNC